MKRLFHTLFLALLFLLIFTLLGGGELVKWIGARTVELGEVIVGYEKTIKRSTRDLWEDVRRKGRELFG